ncbi:MAG: hypothetical protein AAGH15_01605, partial [Myxococcota bacterium]
MRIGLGLRGQLVVALSVAFIGAFALLGVTAIQLGRRSQAAERARDAAAIARTLDAALGPEPRFDAFVRASSALVGEGRVRGVELDGGMAEPGRQGLTGHRPRHEA